MLLFCVWESECEFCCVVFSPSLLGGGGRLGNGRLLPLTTGVGGGGGRLSPAEWLLNGGGGSGGKPSLSGGGGGGRLSLGFEEEEDGGGSLTGGGGSGRSLLMSLVGGGGGGTFEAFDTAFLGDWELEGRVLNLLALLSCGLGGKFGASLVGGGGSLDAGGFGGREETGDCPGSRGAERPGIGGRGRWLSWPAVVGEIGPSSFKEDLIDGDGVWLAVGGIGGRLGNGRFDMSA